MPLKRFYALLVICLAVGSVMARAEDAPKTATRATAPRHHFDLWEKEIAKYEQMDREHPPAKGQILFIGASTIRLWTTLPQDFPQQQVLNRGFGGSAVEDATHFAERIIFPYEPRMIFLRAGGNDLIGGKSPEQVFSDFKDFVAKVRTKLPDTPIVFISASPSIKRWFQRDKEKALNDLVSEYIAQTPGLKFIDIYDMPLGPDGQPRAELFRDDKLHFNDAGYKLLAERVRPYLSN